MSAVVYLLVALAAAGVAFLALAAFCVVRLAADTGGGSVGTATPGVTVLKPLHGAEPGLRGNLESVLRQDYPGEIRFVFGVQNATDPAADVVRELEAAFPDRDIVLVVNGRLHGTNRKVSNLINMMARAGDRELVVLADSDMRVGPDYLRRLVDRLSRPGVGLVTCPYHGIPADGPWATLAALGIDTHFLPGVAASVALGMGRPCMGSTIALRRDTLDGIGGFAGLADDLADDHALGEKVRALGLAVVVAPFTVGHVCPQVRLRDLVEQEGRWLRTVRQIAPAGHAGSLVAHPLPYALAAFASAPGMATACVVAAAVAGRIGLCLAVERAFGLHRHPYWLIPARDLLSFALLLASFFGRGVGWRGYRYEVARSGALLPRPTFPDTTLPGTRPDPT